MPLANVTVTNTSDGIVVLPTPFGFALSPQESSTRRLDLDIVNDSESLAALVAGGVIALQSEEPTIIPGASIKVREHVLVITPDTKALGVAAPTFGNKGCLAYLVFSNPSDEAFRTLKLPFDYAGNATLHVHWTKSQDTDQSGKKARWLIEWSTYNGIDEEATALDGSTELESTYLDSGTTTRIVTRTDDADLNSLFDTAVYVSFKIQAIAPTSDPITAPALVALDFQFDKYVLDQ